MPEVMPPQVQWQVKRACSRDVGALVPLFDAYRRFAREPSDPQLTRRFLEDRLRSGDSVLLIARIAPRKAAGFAQLYRLFDGPACRPMFLLYDFFVDPAARGEGIATALLHAAAEHARAQNAIRLDLMTELSNHAARKLYARAGWTQAEDFAVYCQDPNVARAAQG